MAVVATVANGYDLDYAWCEVGEAYRGAAYYLAEAGSRRALTAYSCLLLYFAAVRSSERLLSSSKKSPDQGGAKGT